MMIDMKDRAEELEEKAKDIEKLKHELSLSAENILYASEALYYWDTEDEYAERIEKHEKALQVYNAIYKKLVRAIGEYNKDIEQERKLHEKEMNVTAQEVAEAREQFVKASDALCEDGDFYGGLKNKNKAWIAYRAAVKKRDAIKEKYAYCAGIKFGWGLFDEYE